MDPECSASSPHGDPPERARQRNYACSVAEEALPRTGRRKHGRKLENIHTSARQTLMRILEEPQTIMPINYPTDIRTAIYTTNSVESLNRSLRKIIKIRGGFPNEEAALKLLFLALRQAAKKWTMPIHHWREALNHFTILWPERMPALERVAS